MTAEYLINMDDGRIVWRNSETDKQVNLKPVSTDIVRMIMNGEVKAMDVVNAISAKIKENGDFNLSQYIEDLKKLNVRRANRQEAPQHEQLRDRSDEEVSVSDVMSASGKSVNNAEKKARVKKANEAVANIPDIFAK